MVCRICCVNDAALLWFEIGRKRRLGPAKRDCYGLSVEFGTLGARVGVIFGKEQSGLCLASGFETVGFDSRHVHEGDVLAGGYLTKLCVIAHVSLNLPVFPDIANGEGKKNGGGFFGASVGDVFPYIPAVGVDRLSVT